MGGGFAPKGGGATVALLMTWVVLVVGIATPSPAGLQEKCGSYMGKLSDCLAYSTAKSDTPSDKCCKSVSEIRREAPVCLCYIIQQTNNASSQAIYSLGLQIARLVQLPQVCNIKNTNVSQCPELLGIPPDSPDYLIFNITAANEEARIGGQTPSWGHCVRRYTWNAAVAASAVLFSSLFSVG